MSVATVLIVTLSILAVYYVFLVAYDLRMAKLAQERSEEDKEEVIDISDQAGEFRSIPVDPDEKKAKQHKFINAIFGITAEKANQMMEAAAEGTPNQELANVLVTIQDYNINYQTT